MRTPKIFRNVDIRIASLALAVLLWFHAVTEKEYRVTLRTPFGETIHQVKIPTQRDITVYRRTVVSATDLPHGQEELRYRIEPSVALYDSVVTKVEGYAGSLKPADVPPHHKSAVVVELVQAIDDLDPALDPNS